MNHKQEKQAITLLTVEQLAKMIGVSKRTIRLWEELQPDFPKRYNFGYKCKRYLLADVLAYIETRKGK